MTSAAGLPKLDAQEWCKNLGSFKARDVENHGRPKL